jgi:uncharacterized protein YjbJ (UPF0337 family)
MNWDELSGNWQQAKGELKVRWGKLTDDDLTVIDGEREKPDANRTAPPLFAGLAE